MRSKELLLFMAGLFMTSGAQTASMPPAYVVVDLSRGANAKSYQVYCLDKPPACGFNRHVYKTTALVLKRVDAGSFIMGDDRTNESHRVTLSKPFYMGIFEVTQKQWELVEGRNPAHFCEDERDASMQEVRPVERVSYNAIRGCGEEISRESFLGRLSMRTGLAFDLPTEAQWEYVCRAGTDTVYNYGKAVDGEYMWSWKNSSLSQTHTVGSRSPNRWGFYDMHGNVAEWCRDWFGALSYGEDPQGPSDGVWRVQRGGSWGDDADFCTSSARSNEVPSNGFDSDGFRVVLWLRDRF